ncbi:hypothetical protein [Actinacidiphila glaucinigra]|uniref:hypothetical protein n=1 Tax=Actinacidiphila glaucinigra TaxID=235986 RepID=UPI00366B7C35
MSEERVERDAEVAPPWDADRDPPMQQVTYHSSRRPRMKIRVAGHWRQARIIARQRYQDGRLAVLCEVSTPSDVGPVWLVRGYWWNPAAMRPIRPAAGWGSLQGSPPRIYKQKGHNFS